MSERGTHFHSSPNAYFHQALQMSLDKWGFFLFISKWVWDQFMWQQLPGLLHLVLQGIYRKKISTFRKIFAKSNNNNKKTPIHPNPVTESQKRGGTKRLTIVTHITAKSWSPGFSSYFWRLVTRNIFSPLLPTYLQQQYSITLEKFGSPGSIGTSRGLSSNETTNIPHSPPLTHERQKHHPSSPQPRHY